MLGAITVEALAQAVLLGVDLVDRLLHGDDLAGVLTELLLDVGLVGFGLLPREVELVQLALLVLGERFLLLERAACWPRVASKS